MESNPAKFIPGRMQMARIIILILLPFLIGSALLPHTEAMKGSPILTPAEIQTSYLQDVQYQFANEVVSMPNQLQVSTIFPIANYVHFWPAVSYDNLQLCFQDTGSYVTYPNGTKLTPNFSWDINVNNRTMVEVPSNSIICAFVNSSESYSFNWVADLSLDVPVSENLSNTSFTPSMGVYPQVIMDYGILQGLAFIPAFYLLIFYPIAGIMKKVDKGLMEQ